MIAALGGVAGPALFTLVVFFAAALRTDYSHLHNFISELGATGTPHAALMNYTGFVPGGLLLGVFGIGLAGALPRQPVTAGATVLVTLFGVGVAASGVVSCDPGCPQAGSLENVIHNRIAPACFLCLIVAAGLLGVRFRRLPDWRGLWGYSLLTGAVAACFLVGLASSLETRALTGLWQRLLLATLFLWCAVVGLRAFRMAGRVGIERAPH